MSAPRRPVLRWHGGKWLLAPWIISHFPPHRVYVEPFGGGASVLLRKERAYGEVYNDLDTDVVGLFRVLREPATADALIAALRLTPFARSEFRASYEETANPVERARRLVIRSFMGFGSDGFNRQVKTGFRATSNRLGTTPAHDWANYPDELAAIVARLVGVVIECRPAIDVMRQQDAPETLHYLDPPYMPATRSGKGRRGGVRYHAYAHEMTDDDHAGLLDVAEQLAGSVVISGYSSPLYLERLRTWRCETRLALADGAKPRTEFLWLNERAAAHGKRLFA